MTINPIKPWANMPAQAASHCQEPGRFEVHSSWPTAGKIKRLCFSLAFISYISSYIKLKLEKKCYPNSASAGASTSFRIRVFSGE